MERVAADPNSATKLHAVIGCHKPKPKQGEDMSRSIRGFFVVLAAAGWMAAGPTVALAQTKPAVTSLGPGFPKTEIFIGNSFFYYNNGMPGHVTLLERASHPDHKQDYRTTVVTIV